MLKNIVKKTLSILVLIALALFLFSFTNRTASVDKQSNYEENSSKLLITENAIVTVSAAQGLNATTYASSGGSRPNFGSQLSTAMVSNINFAWGSGEVLNSGRIDNVIIRFYGWIIPNHTGTTYFYAPADDGVRIRLGSSESNLTLFYDDWVDKGGGGIIRTFETVANQPLYIQFDYYENGGGAHVQLQWSTNGASYSIVPSSAFTITYPTSILSFNSNEGSPVTSIIGEVGLPFSLTSTSTRSGYTFDGWFFDNNTFNNSLNTNSFPLTNQTVFAKWIPIPVNVTLDKAEGSGGPDLISGIFGQNLQVSNAVSPNKEGHIFNGYFSGPNGSGNQYLNSNMVGIRSWDYLVDTTLFAYWTKEIYNFEFKTNFGANSIISNFSASFQESIINKLPLNPTRMGHTFIGWSLEANPISNEQIYSVDQINPIIGDLGDHQDTIIYYAIWSINSYELKTDLNNGSAEQSLTVEYDSIIILENPIKEGYQFDYWYPELPTRMPASDVMLTAVYKRTSVPNDFELNNSESNFENGYLKFSIGIFDPNAHIFIDNILDLANPGSNIEEGKISIIGNVVYYGNGSTVLPFATIDEIDNGDFGNDYLININQNVGSSIITNLIKSVKYSSLNVKQLISVEIGDSNNSKESFVFVNEAPVDSISFDTLSLVNDFNFDEDSIFRIDFDFSNYFSDVTNIQYRFVSKDELQTNYDNFVYFSGNSLYGLGDNDRVGVNYIIIQAFNNEFISDEFIIIINIINTNDAPVLNPIYENLKINIPFNQSFLYQLPIDFMLDVDVGTVLEYSVVEGLAACISFDNLTRTFIGLCDQNSNIGQNVIIQGSDGIVSITHPISFTMDLTVEFETNGGTSVASQTLPYNGTLTIPVEPTKVGHTFVGWYTDSALTNGFNFSSIPLDLIVYAKWSINQYSIYFDSNGGTQVNSIVQNFNSDIIVPPNPTRLGFEFIGWNPTIPSQIPPNNMNIIAQWRPLNYQISFDLMYENAFQIAPILAHFEENIINKLPSNPTRPGYLFNGWFEEIDLVNNYTLPSLMPYLGIEYTDKKLFASWTPIIYRINYIGMLTANTGNPSIYTIESSTINLNTSFLFTGHEFLGFYSNSKFEGEEIKSIATGTFGELTLYANWVKRKYNLVFKDDKGLELSSSIVEFEQTIDTSFFPTADKPGFDFIGWSDNLPSVMPASNVEVIAQFKAKQFKLTIKDTLGNTITDEMVDFESSLSGITLPELEIEGFEFEGWEPSLPPTMPASNLEIVGKYRELPKFKIIIFGTKDEVLLEVEYLEKAQISGITLPDLSNANDFIFEGWDGEIPSIMPGSNLEIRPIGTKKESILNLYSADRTLISSIQAQIGSDLNITQPSRLGFSFAGWTDATGSLKNISVMPEVEESLFASWLAKIYSIQVTVGSNDFNINVTFGEPIGNIVSPQLFGFRFEGWKNNLTGEFLNSNTIFTTPEQINLVPVYTRLNAAETLVAATRLIANFILSLFR
jgi:uncharacterized repeat protein (TIGR02543 family)